MTPLAGLLIRRIQATGPITIADYMRECLLHPKHGYYTTRDPFGAQGDFITAPEISQMYGELIGLSLAQAWIDQGRPTPFTLAELGPGRGTLMADLLRATRSVAGFHESMQVVLVEASETLRKQQRTVLEGFAAIWIDTVADLPNAPLFLIANEFFDALPIRQFQRDVAGWRERQIGVQGGIMTLGLSAPAPVADLDFRLADTKPGDIVEICAPARSVMAEITARIIGYGGVALIVDYGDWRSLGDTLQAMMAHDKTDPLVDPGNADLTAHVDFEALSLAAEPASFGKLTTQGMFLERLGITRRAQDLAQSVAGDARVAHTAAHRRLTHPQEMGSLFKVLGLYPTGMSPPPGLDR